MNIKNYRFFYFCSHITMINYQEFYLKNGLRVIIHEDHATPLAAVNLLYNVGSRDESPDKTGFAHLFEHLMFGGSVNIPSYDEPLQRVGGENNAFTSPDITNYYITIPSINLETAFWLESDRMLSLRFEDRILEVQRKVVIEEFNQRYLNQPYGDVWLKLRPLAYKEHPYRWATIGKEISHIENASMEDVKAFFKKFYTPNNAILVVAGDVTVEQVKHLAEKWFEPIPKGLEYVRSLPVEPRQHETRILEVNAEVPLDALYISYHMPARNHPDFYAADLLSDLLGRGKASRLYQGLVKSNKIFNSINAYIMGSLDPGQLIISGKINQGIDMDHAINSVRDIINTVLHDGIKQKELSRAQNQAVTSLAFQEVEILNRAMNLAFFANMGRLKEYNEETNYIMGVTPDDIQEQGMEILRFENASVLKYFASK